MPSIKKETEGVSLAIRVAPRASRNELAGVEAGVLKVRLTAPPVEGAANQALVKLLAKTLGVAKGKVRVVSGERSRNKRVLIQGLSPKELRGRLGL
ncbi:MAG: YggU family protein [Deltaproteobacteria bacterium]|nr:YggU family protein [Deltaproteobacteria bacterium]